MDVLIPTRHDFVDAARAGRVRPLAVELSLPGLTPLRAFEALRPLGYPVLLESARVNERIGRYSFVSADPYLVMRSRGDTVELGWEVAPEGKYGKRAALKRKPLQKLRELLANYRTERVPGLPPFTGGAVGLLSYDLVHQFECLPFAAVRDLDIPDLVMLFVDAVVAFDHILGRTWLIVNPGAREQEMGFRRPDPGQWGSLYDDSVLRLEALHARIAEAPCGTAANEPGRGPRSLAPELPRERYEAMVRKCKAYIAAGDIYQANLSQRFSADLAGTDPLRLYRSLTRINPSSFAAFMDLGDLQIVSSSPERLVRLADGMADTRPIAGTRRRGADLDETQELTAELLTNEKERAEHIMLLDLERNDLGKVCEYGTVHVDELMAVEDYSHVIHIVSNVQGRLAPGRDAIDLLRAVFPGGTITGVPKVRCMEIIDELEPVGRGPYTGSIGYIANTGDMDLNIVIRTFVVKEGIAYAQTGAGIVADSDPEREYVETLHKAAALKKALEEL